MKHWVVVCAVVALLTGCGGGGGGNSSPPSVAGANVLTVTIGQSNVCRNVNELCTQVTICQPGTSTCQTISDILVDIGSTGLRIFGSVLTPPLLQEVDAQGNPIGECAFFADGTTFWGPVQRAAVVLGDEPAVSVPIQVIAPTFAGQSSSRNPCHNNALESDPAVAFFNGILGIGLFAQDCGLACTTPNPNTLYFSCVIATSSCTGTTVSLADQVQNPAMLLPSDNNGAIISLPAVSSTGAHSISGSLILGIGTAGNNSPPAGVSVLTATSGFVTTDYKGTSYPQSVIDTGSNGYFFPDSTLNGNVCGSFYCPPSLVNLNATLVGANGNQPNIAFQIANASNLFKTGNAAFNNLGGPFSTFIWGIPFFLGRTTYVGFEGQTSSLGTGPLLAF